MLAIITLILILFWWRNHGGWNELVL